MEKVSCIFKAHGGPLGSQKVQTCWLILAYVLASYSNEQDGKKNTRKYLLVSKAFEGFESQSGFIFITLG